MTHEGIGAPRRWAALCMGFLLALSLAANRAAAAEPVLEITHQGQTRHYSRTQLLAHPALRTIEIPADVAYKRPMLFRALPLSELLPQLGSANSVRFVARDGFAATIPAPLLRGGPDTHAWLAVEPAKAPWPALKLGGPSAGPFYLVWTGADKMGISPEQWPYQILRIADSQPLTERFPQLLPQGTPAPNRPEWRGLQAFTVHCAACHQLNGGGDAQLGPDLNRPFSPVEYFQEPFLRRLIRDPAAVRDWSQRHMPGFAPHILPESELDDLLAYFRHMAAQRPPVVRK
ncbi:MAG: c-type cytochrome [Burkholderiaceae bacterium]